MKRGYTDRQIISPPRKGIRENILCPLNETDDHTVSLLREDVKIFLLIIRYRFSTVYGPTTQGQYDLSSLIVRLLFGPC